MSKEMTCIVCPMSCMLHVDFDGEGHICAVSGNTCPRGDAYARKELTNPTRMLTSTVKILNAPYDRLPVIISSDIPKGKLFEVMEALRVVEVSAPVKCKDIIVKNICGLGVDILASRSMPQVD
ncbi:MAG: DUF1667 domain-containing protein [Erysipelotrichaceae bacterium]